MLPIFKTQTNMAGDQKVINSAGDILSNIVNDLFKNQSAFEGPLFKMVMVFFGLIALFYCYKSLRRVYEVAESMGSSMTAGQRGRLTVAGAYFFTACLLFQAPVLLGQTANSLDPQYGMMSYSESSLAASDKFSAVAKQRLRHILIIVQFFGFCWFIHGISKIPAAAEGNDPKWTGGKILIRCVSGAFVANIYLTIVLIEKLVS